MARWLEGCYNLWCFASVSRTRAPVLTEMDGRAENEGLLKNGVTQIGWNSQVSVFSNVRYLSVNELCPLQMWNALKSSICLVLANPPSSCLFVLDPFLNGPDGGGLGARQMFPQTLGVCVCLLARVRLCLCALVSECETKTIGGRKMGLIWKEKQSQGNPLRDYSIGFDWAPRFAWPVVNLTM